MREAMERMKERSSIVQENKIKKKTIIDKVIEDVKKEMGVKSPSALTRSTLENDPYEKAKRDYHKISSSKEVETKKNKSTSDNTEQSDEEDCSDEDNELDDAGKSEQDMLDLTKVDRTIPYIINDREFAEEFDHHDKISLYYYRVDDVLCEENEEIIDNIEGTIGYDALTALDMQTTVWVRNEPLAIDYEVIALNSSFAESVHGVHIQENNRILTPRERYNERQQKRREKEDGE